LTAIGAKTGKGPVTHPAMMGQSVGNGDVVCRLCAHLCHLRPGQTGRCLVRHNAAGALVTSAYGRPALLASEPIEKKYLFHYLPGSRTLSLGTAGCNLGCTYCINWRISQTGVTGAETVTPPAQVVAQAAAAGATIIAFTYTEPTIFIEYARDIAHLARQAGLAVVAKSNGYMTADALREMAGWLDGINIDLKGWVGPGHDRVVGGALNVVLDNLRLARALGLWLEVSSLLLPGLNTDAAALRGMAGFIADELGPDTPWHLLRFFPHYLATAQRPTAQAELATAVQIGREAGLRYIYNRELNRGAQWQTACPRCRARLITRAGFTLVESKIAEDGRCPQCREPAAGVFAPPAPKRKMTGTNDGG
jgi:pyruvate formate lyase activating enzyme